MKYRKTIILHENFLLYYTLDSLVTIYLAKIYKIYNTIISIQFENLFSKIKKK